MHYSSHFVVSEISMISSLPQGNIAGETVLGARGFSVPMSLYKCSCVPWPSFLHFSVPSFPSSQEDVFLDHVSEKTPRELLDFWNGVLTSSNSLKPPNNQTNVFKGPKKSAVHPKFSD